MQLTSDLFERLINHRVSADRARREDYLTEVFAWMLQNDVDLRERVLAADGPLYEGTHPEHVPAPGAPIVVETQDTQTLDYGRPDLTLKNEDDPSWCLVIESKVDAPFEHQQIDNYLQGMKDSRNTRVVALVPRAEAMLHGGEVQHRSFLGIRCWQDIATLVPQGEEGLDETQASLRDAFRKLLVCFGLVDIPHSRLSWQAQKTAEEVEQVLSLSKRFDHVTDELAGQPEVLGRELHRFYGPEGGRLRLGKYPGQHPIRSGSGAPPRPVLAHRTSLRSAALGIGSFDFEVAFRGYSDARPDSAPAVSTGLWAGPTVGGKWIHDEATALRQLVLALGGPGDQLTNLESRAPELLARYLKRVGQVMSRLSEQLQTSELFPNVESTPSMHRWQARLHLCSTEEFLGAELHTKEAQERFANGLREVLRAFIASEPERPMAMLLAECCCDGW